MGLCKRVIISIVKRPFRAVSMAVVVFILSVMVMAGAFLKEAVNAYFEEYVRMEGFCISIFTVDNSDIPERIITEISSMDHVTGSNYTPTPITCTPGNFINAPYETNGVFSQAEDRNEIILVGNYQTDLYESFRNGDMVLIEGSYPSSENPGVLIDDKLAQLNELEIGSILSLYAKEDSEAISLSVVGIYKTISPPMTDALGGGRVIESSSYIFGDMDTYCSFTGERGTRYIRYFYADSYENLAKLYEKIKMSAPEEDGYQVINALDSSMSWGSDTIQVLQRMATALISFSYVVSLIILFLMTMLWMQDHYKEAGIFITLGESKMKVVMYFWLEIVLITGIALIISLGVGSVIIHNYREQIINFAISFANSGFVIGTVKNATTNNAFSLRSLLSANVYYFIIVSAATLFSGWIMIRRNVRGLLEAK